MKEYKVNSGYVWHAWFWVDKEEFEGEWKIGTLRYRVEKAVGRADDGKLFLMVWTNHDQHDWHKFSQVFYEYLALFRTFWESFHNKGASFVYQKRFLCLSKPQDWYIITRRARVFPGSS